MMHLLFNPLACNNRGTMLKDLAKSELQERFSNIKEHNVLEINKEEFLKELAPDEEIVLIGGDGTLNKFANEVYGLNLSNPMYLYKAGTGNDFLNDVNKNDEKLFLLNDYIKKLPKITINGVTKRFINGIGFGLDGEVCVIADQQKEKGKKKINYTSIAIKLLLFKYHKPDATVILDGKKMNFKKVWLASAMNGRYYGGGMEMAPNQDRFDNYLSFVGINKSGRFKTLMIFPKIFKGQHIKYTKYVYMQRCKKIEVQFSSPRALQIDGDVINNVTSYIAEYED